MKLVNLIILLATTFTAVGQKQTFGLIRYTPPAGWAVEKSESIIKYTGSVTGSQDYCHWIIYKNIPASADGKTNFDAAWRELIAKTLGVTNAPQLQPTVTDQGWETISGFATFMDNGSNTVALLITMSGENQMQNLVMITNSQKFGTDTQLFTESIEMVRAAGAIQTNQTLPVKEEVTVLFGAKAELWMNLQLNPTSLTASSSIKPQFYTVYANGDYYPHMPTEGLLNLNKNTYNNDSWGTFTTQGNSASFTSKYENLALIKVSPSVMEKKGSTFKFYKCVSVDGLRLDGTWSYIPNWTKDPYYSQAGARPVIHFKKDGTFDDRGIFVSNFNNPTQYPENKPGTGTYSISNFTLILKYQDGRTVYKAFSGVADKDPATVNDALYIGTNPFYKK